MPTYIAPSVWEEEIYDLQEGENDLEMMHDDIFYDLQEDKSAFWEDYWISFRRLAYEYVDETLALRKIKKSVIPLAHEKSRELLSNPDLLGVIVEFAEPKDLYALVIACRLDGNKWPYLRQYVKRAIKFPKCKMALDDVRWILGEYCRRFAHTRYGYNNYDNRFAFKKAIEGGTHAFAAYLLKSEFKPQRYSDAERIQELRTKEETEEISYLLSDRLKFRAPWDNKSDTPKSLLTGFWEKLQFSFEMVW